MVTGVRRSAAGPAGLGEPHAGERVWRNLLKADPSVDLIPLHPSCARPSSRITPDRVTTLIQFPTRELFLENALEASTW